jgi:SAM-dependent methyltransferase
MFKKPTMTAQMPPFVNRSCPSCFASQPRPLFQISPSQFSQPLYTPEVQQRFGIERDRKFGVVRCGRCSFVYAEHEPPPALTVLLYDSPDAEDSTAEKHESLRPAWVSHQLQLASALLGAIASEFGNTRPAILDFGCGFGALVRALNGPTAHCVGYETSAFMVRYMQTQGLPVVSVLSDAPRNLHGIILSDVLEHLPEPRSVLRDLRKLLVPKGLLCVNVPDFNERRVRMIAKQLKHGQRPPQELNPWGHLNYFSPESLRRMLCDEGFHPIERQIDIGLRPNLRGVTKIGNAIKSIGRLLAYTATSRNNAMLIVAQAR